MDADTKLKVMMTIAIISFFLFVYGVLVQFLPLVVITGLLLTFFCFMAGPQDTLLGIAIIAILGGGAIASGSSWGLLVILAGIALLIYALVWMPSL